MVPPIFQNINKKFLVILPAGKPVRVRTECEKKTENSADEYPSKNP